MTEPLPFAIASTQMFCWVLVTVGRPSTPICSVAFGIFMANAVLNRAPSGAVKVVPFGSDQAWVGSVLTTVMLPPACVGVRFSYLAVPPASRMLPSGSSMCPAQNRSHGVGISFSCIVTGFSSSVLNVPASKNAWLFPDPAMISTSPL